MFGRKSKPNSNIEQSEAVSQPTDYERQAELRLAESIADTLMRGDEDFEDTIVRYLTKYSVQNDSRYKEYVEVSNEEVVRYNNDSELSYARERLDHALAMTDEDFEKIIQKEYDRKVAERDAQLSHLRDCLQNVDTVYRRTEKWQVPEGNKYAASFRLNLMMHLRARRDDVVDITERWESRAIERDTVESIRKSLVDSATDLVEGIESGSYGRARSRAIIAKQKQWVDQIEISLASSRLTE